MARYLPKWQLLPTATSADEKIRDRMLTQRCKNMPNNADAPAPKRTGLSRERSGLRTILRWWPVLIYVMLALVVPLLFVYVSVLAAGYSPSFFPESGGFISLGIQADQPNIFRQVKRVLANAGAMGDYFGGLLNPIVALCALIGLAISIDVQRKTLHETRKGLREQLDQENFFQLLANRESAIQNLELNRRDIGFAASLFRRIGFVKPASSAVYTGRSAIREVLNYIDLRMKDSGGFDENHVQEVLRTFDVDPLILKGRSVARRRVCLFIILYTGLHNSEEKEWSDEILAWANAILNDFRNDYAISNIEELMGHVFRATYQVLKFVHKSGFDDRKKLDLVNYLRAQMSEAEFAAFALTGLTSIGKNSRAVSIAFDFYQRRLLSTEWASDFLSLFKPQEISNRDFAKDGGYEPVELLLTPAHQGGGSPTSTSQSTKGVWSSFLPTSWRDAMSDRLRRRWDQRPFGQRRR